MTDAIAASAPSPEISEPALRPTVPQKKARPIPSSVKTAIKALQSGKAKNLVQAAKVAGVSREYFSRTLSARPDIIESGHNRARRLIAVGAWVATPQMLELVRSKSSRTSFEVCRYLLGVAGI